MSEKQEIHSQTHTLQRANGAVSKRAVIRRDCLDGSFRVIGCFFESFMEFGRYVLIEEMDYVLRCERDRGH